MPGTYVFARHRQLGHAACAHHDVRFSIGRRRGAFPPRGRISSVVSASSSTRSTASALRAGGGRDPTGKRTLSTSSIRTAFRQRRRLSRSHDQQLRLLGTPTTASPDGGRRVEYSSPAITSSYRSVVTTSRVSVSAHTSPPWWPPRSRRHLGHCKAWPHVRDPTRTPRPIEMAVRGGPPGEDFPSLGASTPSPGSSSRRSAIASARPRRRHRPVNHLTDATLG